MLGCVFWLRWVGVCCIRLGFVVVVSVLFWGGAGVVLGCFWVILGNFGGLKT